MPIVRTEARRLYQCDSCGGMSAWTADHVWYGSWKALDNDEPIQVTCSADCRIKMVAAGKLPHEGLDDRGNAIVEDTTKRRKAALTPHERQP